MSPHPPHPHPRLTNLPKAGGHSGRAIATELLKTGKHTVTALARSGGSSNLPTGITTKSIDYSNPSTLVEALRGQDALVITLSAQAPPDTQMKLIEAAAEAGVSWILPNEWSPDSDNEGLRKDVFLFDKLYKTNQAIAKLGKSSYIAVTCGFWYEWSLAFPGGFGFDFAKKSVTFFDDGETKMTTSTWPQVGRAVAALLSLPVKAEGGDAERSLDAFRNKHVYIGSFTVNQKDMFESVLRVTGTKKEEWKVGHEKSEERYKEGFEAMQKGDRSGFIKMMYTRVFYPDDSGDFEKTKGLANGLLGLPKEELDEFTKVGIERSSNPAA